MKIIQEAVRFSEKLHVLGSVLQIFFIGKPYRDDCDCSARFASRMFLSLSRKICKLWTGFQDPDPEEPKT